MAAATPASSSRPTVAELRRQCENRGLSTSGCVERADLEALLAGTAGPAAAAMATAPALTPVAAVAGLAEARAELESWVGYGPRAVTLLDFFGRCDITVPLLRQTKLGITVRRYTRHPDGAAAARASRLIEQWKGLLRGGQQAPSPGPAPKAEPGSSAGGGTGGGAEEASGDEDSGESGSSGGEEEEECIAADPGGSAAGGGGAAAVAPPSPEPARQRLPEGWQAGTQTQVFRGKKERFHVFTLKRPFGAPQWAVRVRIAHDQHRPECRELLQRMAVDFGAAAPSGDEVDEVDRQVITRLQRLEERFRGSGVTEGEARNAMRLFERELSKANWTEDKFVKLKRQLAGTEEWSAADAVAETSLVWLQKGRRRQAWFADAGARVAMPLGLEAGYCDNGGCCFAGPLSAAAGAALTTALVAHLGHLDLERAVSAKGRQRTSAPQFLQGFVDGALERERHLVWERLFSIEDEEEAARFCEESRQSGFFDNAEGAEAESDQGADGEDDIPSLLRNLFSARTGAPAQDPPQPTGARARQPPAPSPAPAPHEYTPFSGKAQRLGEQVGGSSPSGARPEGSGATGSSQPREQQSWALTFASNLELVRSSKRRSQQEARKSYHWRFSGHAVKPTQTGTESYSRGREAGQQRKHEIDGAAGSARQKFQKKPRLAIAG